MPNKKKSLTIFMFNCPVHGITCTTFCFRAHDKENLGRWLVLSAPLREPTEEELEKIKLQMGIRD